MPKNNGLLVISIILVQTLLIILINSNILTSQNIESLHLLVPWINMVVLVIAILSILAIKQFGEHVKNNMKVQLLKSHLQQVENLLTILQAQKHEYGRHIQAIQSLVHLGRNEEVKKYINGIAEDYWHMEDMHYIGHPAITGLINSKRSTAEFQGIEFAVAVKCDLSRIKVEPWDLCSILGNLLDNAIEAALEDKDQPRVAIEFKHESGEYAIYIHNNGHRISKTEEENIFEPGYTTKGSDARGYGLYLVKKLLDRCEGSIEIMSNKQTIVIVRLPGEETDSLLKPGKLE